MGIISTLGGAGVVIGGTMWLRHVDTAIAQQAKVTESQSEVLAEQDRRLTVVESDLKYIAKGQDRLEVTAKEQMKILQEVRDGQREFRAIVENLPSQRPGNR